MMENKQMFETTNQSWIIHAKQFWGPDLFVVDPCAFSCPHGLLRPRSVFQGNGGEVGRGFFTSWPTQVPSSRVCQALQLLQLHQGGYESLAVGDQASKFKGRPSKSVQEPSGIGPALIRPVQRADLCALQEATGGPSSPAETCQPVWLEPEDT